MPFKSEAQRRYMWSQHPKIAREWTQEEKQGAVERKMKKNHDKKKKKDKDNGSTNKSK